MSRIKRQNFTAAVKTEIMTRAGYPDNPRCENPSCGCSLKKCGGQLDHKVAEWILGGKHDERSALTANDGWMLCPDCHKIKTKGESRDRAHGNRIILKAAGATTSKGRKLQGRGFQTNRDGPYRKPFHRDAEKRGD